MGSWLYSEFVAAFLGLRTRYWLIIIVVIVVVLALIWFARSRNA